MNNLMELFIRDSRKYISQIIDSLIRYENNTETKEQLDNAFRAVHSIKTESSYLLLSDVKDLSHSMEDELEKIRSGKEDFSKEKCSRMIEKAEALQILIDKAEEENPPLPELIQGENSGGMLSIPDELPENENIEEHDELEELEEEPDEPDELEELEELEELTEDIISETAPVSAEVSFDKLKDEPVSETGLPEVLSEEEFSRVAEFSKPSFLTENSDESELLQTAKTLGTYKEIISPKAENDIENLIKKEFNDFQIQLLSDSMKRGEKLYRIICDISSSSTMKYPRLYLIINNLELHTNLVKTIPSVDIIEKGEETRITCFITTRKNYSEIYKIINVDEVKDIQIINIPYEYLFRQEKNQKYQDEKSSAEKTIPVKIDRLDSLFVSVQSMRLSLMMKDSSSDYAVPDSILESLESMEKSIRLLRMVSLSEEFKTVPAAIRKIAYSKGKEVSIVFNDNGVEIDRSIFELIYDPVIHLFKNAIDHGIETVEERLEKSKNRSGKIVCSSYSGSGYLVIEIADDGKGLDLNKIAEKTGYTVTELADEKRVVSILTAPGFTTKKDADEHSGRGFGLNLVKEKLSKTDGASLEIKTNPGKGTTVRLKLPDNYIARKVLYFTRGGRITAVDAECVEAEAKDIDAFLKQKSNGQLFYKDLPVYTKDGIVFSGSPGIKNSKGIIFKNNGKKGLLLADKILFTQTIPADRLYLLHSDLPYLYSMRVAGMEREYIYIDCSILE
ncbi:MAG: ATP-binding protein [Spirochaetia bacterium]|jgi:two-component system chemotaxis sensor kinase CheA|nr:ATP-binding protein [Spirochaetia bacterium]